MKQQSINVYVMYIHLAFNYVIAVCVYPIVCACVHGEMLVVCVQRVAVIKPVTCLLAILSAVGHGC